METNLLPCMDAYLGQLREITTTRLRWNPTDKVHEEVSISPDALIVDGQLLVGNDNGTDFLDAYGEFRGGYQWIHPELEAWARERDGYWEWRDAGSIVFVPR